jgi:AsmA protein
MNRGLKIAAIVIGVLIVIVIAIPFFIDANSFRPKIETELTDSLGRQVKVGNLSLSLFSGAVTADNISIADDPAFSKTDFVQAKSLKVGVEILPLIFSKDLNVTDLTLDQPEINLVQSQTGGTWNFSSIGTNKSAAQPASTNAAQPAATTNAQPAAASAPPNSSSANTNPNLSVKKLKVTNGRVTVTRANSTDKPRVYDKVDVEVTDFSFTNSFPFQMTADLPAGGTLKLDGKAGPINANNAALTPLEAKVEISNMNLAASGFIDPASGIAGIANFDGTIASDGHQAKASGTLKADKLQLAPKSQPAARTVQLQYSATYDLVSEAGTITQGVITIGKAVANLTGTYDAHGRVTSINMKITGQGMPVDDLEAVLPAVGVVLPSGSQLKGGTLNVDFTSTGPVDKLVTTGTLKMENAALANFNLASKLSAIPSLNGKGGGGNSTTIQNFSSNVRVAPEGTRADDINMTAPPFGSVTGAGTVSPNNAIDFKLKADSIPILVTGTTSDPKFAPDLKGLAGSLLSNKNLKSNPVSGVSGLFKKN